MPKRIIVAKPELGRIYQKIGREKRLREILRKFYRRMSTDLLIGFYFDGKDLDAIADMQTLFLMRAMGARPTYTGKPPAKAHEELAPILSGHFDRRLRILEEVLREEGLNDEDIRIWITFENAFREGIVSVDPTKFR
jgi:truncated hemoglobin YjbI